MTRDTHAHIGHLAGVVYRALERRGGKMSVLDLSLSERLWPWDVIMAFGWLEREGKIKLSRSLFALMASLR
jgi:hypothetical protein